MKPLLKYSTLIAFCFCLFLSSCVTKRKFLESEQNLNRLRGDSTQTHKLLEDCDSRLNTCFQNLGDCNAEKSNIENARTRLLGKLYSSEKSFKDYSSKTKMTIEDQARRLQALENLLQSQRDAMNRLKKTIGDALVNFNPDELSVFIKDGKLYVSMEEKLLFKSGSAVVDPKGKEALGKVAQVINGTPDITIMIEGHTDTVPIRNASFADNWALSTGRATSIVRILTKDYGLDAHRITASGRGEFHPVQTNSTTTGKAANRRTEIIISPNLSELYRLLE
jgi:chemotaxis protein MotB